MTVGEIRSDRTVGRELPAFSASAQHKLTAALTAAISESDSVHPHCTVYDLSTSLCSLVLSCVLHRSFYTLLTYVAIAVDQRIRRVSLLLQSTATATATDMTETPKADKQSNVTESTGKVCSACEEKKLKAAFSKKQWLEPAAARRCSECVAANKATKAAQPANPTTATTSSSPPTTTTSTTTSQPQPKLRPNKTIPHAIVQPKRNAKRPPLLDNDGDWFLPSAESALTEIFNRFDADGDGQWTIRETQSFATATNGKPFTTEELYEVTNHFFKDNKLPRQGFLQFYHLQTSSHPAETWKDMQKLGYGWDVKSGAILPPAHVKQPPQSEGNGEAATAAVATDTAAAES